MSAPPVLMENVQPRQHPSGCGGSLRYVGQQLWDACLPLRSRRYPAYRNSFTFSSSMTQERLSTTTFRYRIIMMAVASTLLGIIACFNALVDPFAMYQKVEIAGFNMNKPAIYSRMRLYKAFEVERVRSQTVILGSSRTHVGLRCSHEALAKLEGPCYNLAFDGATAKEMYFYLRHAH